MLYNKEAFRKDRKENIRLLFIIALGLLFMSTILGISEVALAASSSNTIVECPYCMTKYIYDDLHPVCPVCDHEFE